MSRVFEYLQLYVTNFIAIITKQKHYNSCPLIFYVTNKNYLFMCK